MLGTRNVSGLMQDLGPALQIFLVNHIPVVEHARIAKLAVNCVVITVMGDNDVRLQIPAKIHVAQHLVHHDMAVLPEVEDRELQFETLLLAVGIETLLQKLRIHLVMQTKDAPGSGATEAGHHLVVLVASGEFWKRLRYSAAERIDWPHAQKAEEVPEGEVIETPRFARRELVEDVGVHILQLARRPVALIWNDTSTKLDARYRCTSLVCAVPGLPMRGIAVLVMVAFKQHDMLVGHEFARHRDDVQLRK